MSGPPPKPTAIRVMQGNPARRPLPENEPTPPPADLKPPLELKGAAKRYWLRIAPGLHEQGLLTTLDTDLLAELCATWAEFWAAVKDVEKRGIEIDVTRYDRKTGNAYYVTEDNPSVRIKSDSQKRLKALRAEFGMSPSSRTRVKATPKPVEKSALEKLRERRQA